MAFARPGTATIYRRKFLDAYFNTVNLIKDRGITAGCTLTTFCPDDNITRAQMAVFIIRALNYSKNGNVATFWPSPHPTTPYYTDVPSGDIYFPFIQQLRALGIAVGCTATTFCPNDPVTHGQAAVYAVRARQLRDNNAVVSDNDMWNQPCPTYYTCLTHFSDADNTNIFYPWIQRARDLMGPIMTAPYCSTSSTSVVCPNTAIRRGWMSFYITAVAMPAAYVSPSVLNLDTAGQWHKRSFSFYSTERKRTYFVFSEAILTATPVTMYGHWVYQPSVVLPAPETGNQYVMLFTSNYNSNEGQNQGEAIWKATSTDGMTFTTPTRILDNLGSTVGNICDMADARPVWTGSEWQVYIQAVLGNYQNPQSCSSSEVYNNHVIMARGSTLDSLQWVVDGSNNIQPVITPAGTCNGVGACGIGEEMQMFNSGPYGGSSTNPLIAVFNNWNNTAEPERLFTQRSSNGLPGTWGTWFDRGPAFANSSANGGNTNSLGTPPTYWHGIGPAFPDVILNNSIDGSTLGHPGFVAWGDYNPTFGSLTFSSGLGFFADPVPYTPFGDRQYRDGIEVFGKLASTRPIGSTEEFYNFAMFRPRFARNIHGYLQPLIDNPKVWQTFLYYNTHAENSSYSNWQFTNNIITVSRIIIMEQ